MTVRVTKTDANLKLIRELLEKRFALNRFLHKKPSKYAELARMAGYPRSRFTRVLNEKYAEISAPVLAVCWAAIAGRRIPTKQEVSIRNSGRRRNHG